MQTQRALVPESVCPQPAPRSPPAAIPTPRRVFSLSPTPRGSDLLGQNVDSAVLAQEGPSHTGERPRGAPGGRTGRPRRRQDGEERWPGLLLWPVSPGPEGAASTRRSDGKRQCSDLCHVTEDHTDGSPGPGAVTAAPGGAPRPGHAREDGPTAAHASPGSRGGHSGSVPRRPERKTHPVRTEYRVGSQNTLTLK